MFNYIWKIIKSFGYAFQGIWESLKERNMRLHILAAVVVTVGGFLYGITKLEWMTLMIVIAGVWGAEMFNTAVEDLADVVRDHCELDYSATTRCRNLAAGGVLSMVIAAVIIGIWIFVVPLF